jgi:hypothetical protein
MENVAVGTITLAKTVPDSDYSEEGNDAAISLWCYATFQLGR